MRSVTAALSGNTKLMGAVMGRFVRNDSGAQSNYGFIDGGEIPIDFNYSFSANDDGVQASGDFVKEFIGGENQNDTILSGDFEVHSDDDGSSTINLPVNSRGKSR